MSPVLLFSFVIGYFILLLAVAYRTSRNSNNDSFFIGNRNSNWMLVAFGMIGTLLGLIIMLGQMSDPTAIGAGMAVALLTTLYGTVAANAIFLPASDKLAYFNRAELRQMELVIKGIMAIQSGEHPRIVEQRLILFLPPTERAAKLRNAA